MRAPACNPEAPRFSAHDLPILLSYTTSKLITFGITALPLSGTTFASSLSPASNAAPKHFPFCKNLKWSYDVFIR